LAADEASLYLQATLMRVFVPVGQTPVVKVAANRDRTHFYGALNLATGEEVVLRSELMNAEASALFLNRLLQTYPDQPILLLWDRATWHKGEAIRSVLAANPRLQIVWFPPGCPELNPQEHVWKAVREAVSHNHTWAKLPDLAQVFETYLQETQFPCSLLEKHGYDLLSTRFI
jgi:transposase